MNRVSFLLKVVCLLATWLAGQQAPAQVPISSNRFLFIVETSRAMKKQLPGAVQSVQELLASGMNGQLQPGDTLGVWTFDNELHTGIFPMQIWTGNNRRYIADAVAGFLSQQKIQGRARLAAVYPAMLQLIEESEALTVLLYSEGSQPIKGTPFDDSINEAYKQHYRELIDARLPFVTVLVGRAGKIVKCTINSAVGVNVPELPLTEEAIVPAKTATASNQPPVRLAAPLIVDYSKSNVLVAAAHRDSPGQGGGDASGQASAATNHSRVQPLSVVTTTVPSQASLMVETQAMPVSVASPVSAGEGVPASETVTAHPAGDLPSPRPMGETSGGTEALAEVRSEQIVTNKVDTREVGTHRGVWLALGAGAGALAIQLIWLIKTRLRPSRRTGGSLITKSFDRGKNA